MAAGLAGDQAQAVGPPTHLTRRLRNPPEAWPACCRLLQQPLGWLRPVAPRSTDLMLTISTEQGNHRVCLPRAKLCSMVEASPSSRPAESCAHMLELCLLNGSRAPGSAPSPPALMQDQAWGLVNRTASGQVRFARVHPMYPIRAVLTDKPPHAKCERGTDTWLWAEEQSAPSAFKDAAAADAERRDRPGETSGR